MKRYLLSGICYLLSVAAANAVCPVCTVAIGAGLEGARLLGVDDIVTGVWAGAMTLVMVFWTAKFLAKKKIQNAAWYVLSVVVWYGFLAVLYLMPGMEFGANTIFGIDKFMLGAIIGTVTLYSAEMWNAKIRRMNGGKSKFKFQKVIVPFGALITVSGIIALALYLYA